MMSIFFQNKAFAMEIVLLIENLLICGLQTKGLKSFRLKLTNHPIKSSNFRQTALKVMKVQALAVMRKCILPTKKTPKEFKNLLDSTAKKKLEVIENQIANRNLLLLRRNLVCRSPI